VLGPLGEALQVLGAAGGHRTENHPETHWELGQRLEKTWVNSG